MTGSQRSWTDYTSIWIEVVFSFFVKPSKMIVILLHIEILQQFEHISVYFPATQHRTKDVRLTFNPIGLDYTTAKQCSPTVHRGTL